MSETASGVVFLASLVLVLVLARRPVGRLLHSTATSERDLAAGREEFACHRSQYTPAEMGAINRYLAHAWDGRVWLRPWTGALRDPGVFR